MTRYTCVWDRAKKSIYRSGLLQGLLYRKGFRPGVLVGLRLYLLNRKGVSTEPSDLRQALLAVRSGDDPALSMTYSCGSTMDNSRAFRHELLLRVTRAKRGTESFRPLCNTTNDLVLCSQCGKMAPKMKHCSGCKWARYCHRECQKANWLTHRNDCCPDRCLPAGIRTIPYRIRRVG